MTDDSTVHTRTILPLKNLWTASCTGSKRIIDNRLTAVAVDYSIVCRPIVVSKIRRHYAKTINTASVLCRERSPAFDCEEEASALITDGVAEMLTLDSPARSLLALLPLVAMAG